MMIQRPQETETVIRSVRLVSVGEQEQAPAPLVRVMTCGLLTLEIAQERVSADPPQARYAVLTPDRLRGRGVGPALSLLKLLVSRPQRFAPADWLLEQFCQSEGEAFSSKRLDTLAWLLRDLLCPSAYATLRRQIVAHTRAMGGAGYQLAGYPLIWVDHEALCWNVEQAVRMERFGDDPLPFWQRAYELAKRGEYFPDEVYSEWAEARREEIAGLRRQSVLALARLFTEREGRAGEEEALVLLRSSWTEHPRDEDILRPLMELLGKREGYQEALGYYAKLCDLLSEDDQQPDSHTQDVVEYLRAKRIRRTSQSSTHAQEVECIADRKNAIIQQTVLGEEVISSSFSLGICSPFPGGKRMASFDSSRRSLLQHLLGFTGFAASLSVSEDALEPILSPSLRARTLDASTLEILHGLIEACWQLCNRGNMKLAELVLASFLSHVIERAAFQPEAAKLTSQGLRLKSIIEAHQLHLAQMIPLCQQSVAYAQAANDPDSLSAAFNGLAVAYKYNRQFHHSFETYQAALLASERATPLLRSRVYAGSAEAFAARGFKQEARRLIGQAYEQFPDHPERDPSFYSADNGLFMLAYYEGLLYLALQEPDKAIRAFEKSKSLTLPDRNRLEIINHWGRAAILLGDLERYVCCLEEGVSGAIAIQSQKRLDEAIEIFQEQVPQSWLADPMLKQVTEKFSLPLPSV
jgi:tetratricopeptide (TPR) repeat protein